MIMSTPKLAEPLKMFKKPSNCRINSEEELDVFEATKYFSDVHAVSHYKSGAYISQKTMSNERQPWRAQRISLDMHNLRNSQTSVIEKPMKPTKEKEYKQPSSPGGKLASFLNSLFNQTSSKKKTSLKDGDENLVVRRKRRSSISHVWTTRSNHNNNSDTKSSIYQSSTSGSRTPPPPYSYTTNKPHQELQRYITHQKVLNFNRVDEKKHGNLERKNNECLNKGYSEKFKSSRSEVGKNPRNAWDGQNNPGEKKEFKNFSEDSYDSDSSSDLFELKNYDLNFCSSTSGLPAYETTNSNSIKKGAPLCRG